MNSSQSHQFQPCQSLLIVDDNHGVREALIAALNAKGYTARGAANGKDAIATLKNLKAPTLIFMDLMMPVMDGWESLELLNQSPEFSESIVVTISAVNLKSRQDARIPMNAVANLQKPLSLKQVLQLVQRYCGSATTVSSQAVGEAHP